MGSSEADRSYNLKVKRYREQVMPARQAVVNLLLDAWLADHAHKVKLAADQERLEEKEACLLAFELRRPDVIESLLDTGLQVDKMICWYAPLSTMDNWTS